ncbi:MAG TPA: P1 family peptidase [Gaiellaceae bacterium]|nr:P1 family peptidase [Gaiellaceae bacterium]
MPGLSLRGQPGPSNAITDVAGVRVGHTTIVRGDGPLRVGQGPVRTGVTVIVPAEERPWRAPLFAGCHRLNGNGELTGLEWVRESGTLTSPVALTNTHSVGVVRDALVRIDARDRRPEELWWSLPVVGETWDGLLNDVAGQHVTAEHVEDALAAARAGAVAEGNVGGGTGMICHGFKGGIGTASRITDSGFTVGVLVQANHGRRERLIVGGVSVGERLEAPLPAAPANGGGSIIVVVASDAPLLPNQCSRLAQRAGLGIARLGGGGEHFSGDLFLAFATGNRCLPASDYGADAPLTVGLQMLVDSHITPLFDAVADATEEAILNALLAAETMTGRDGITAHALEPTALAEALAL